MRLRMCLLSVLTALSLTGATGLVTAPAAGAQTTAEAKFVQKINNVRARHGLAPLRARAGLTRYARDHSRSMAGGRSLFHTTSFSSLCCWSSISENVGTGAGVRSVHRTFLRSVGHRANILDPNKKAVGVGVVRSGDGIWVTEVFRQPT